MDRASCSPKPLPGQTAFLCLVDISKKVQLMKQKLKKKNRSYAESSDLNIFKELCTHKDGIVRGVACKTVKDLVKCNLLSLPQALSWFIAILQSHLGSYHDGIIRAIADLLLLNDDNQFICSPTQHPFVLILRQNETTNWSIIEFQIDYIFEQESAGNFQKAFSLVMPVFQYILWSKGSVSSLCRRAAWMCLLRHFRAENFDFLLETICWCSTEDLNSTLDVYYVLTRHKDELLEIMKRNSTASSFCVYYAYISCKLAEHGYDPAIALSITRKLLKEYPTSVNIILALFAQTLTRCPVEFLNTFLLACVELIVNNKRSCTTTKWLIISAIMPWLLYPSCFTEDVQETAEILFDAVHQHETYDFEDCENHSSILISDKYFIRIVNSEKDLHWAFTIACTLEKSNYMEFLDRIGRIRIHSKEIACCPLMHLGIGAILLSENDIIVQIKALAVLVNLNAAFYLPHILYLLSKASGPELKLKLLYSLPLTAATKENVRPVLRSIDSFFLSGKEILLDLSMELYSSLWKIEERCYSYLHDRLLEYETSSENVWRKDVILASIIRDICAAKPHKHGEEWISVLNEIIKRWHKKQDGSLPSALALDAIISLCQAEVLEAIKIYKLLAERLFDDNRVEVLKKFHSLIGYVFEKTKKDAFDQFKDVLLHAVSKMWLVISSSTQNEVIFSAISALSKFDKNEMPLKVIPDVYKKHAKLPQQCTNKSENGIAVVKDQLPYVPGNVWIYFLRSVQPQVRSHVYNMYLHWLRDEVDNFPRSLYGSIRGEPKDLKILHDRCLFKALIDFLKNFSKRSTSFKEDDLETSIICLKLLNGDLPKTLPLFNWTFLLPLLQIQQTALTEQIITLLSKQSCTSSSARVSVEDYLRTFANVNKVDDLRIVFNVLPDLCRGISTVVLKNFLEFAEAYAYEKSRNEDETLLPFIWDRFAVVLRSRDIDENNRICISDCVKTFWEKTAYDDQAFGNLLNAAIELPSTYVDYLCSCNESQLFPDQVCKIIKLRCAMAIKSNVENPFIWLQRSIEITALFPEKQEFYFDCSLPILKKYRSNSNCWLWLLQYTSYIHSAVNELSEVGLCFVLNTLIFTVINLSVYEPFVSDRFTLEEYFRLFPQALNSVVVDKASNQIIDWLQITTKSPKFDQLYNSLFCNALISLKNNEHLSKTNVWSKVSF